MNCRVDTLGRQRQRGIGFAGQIDVDQLIEDLPPVVDIPAGFGSMRIERGRLQRITNAQVAAVLRFILLGISSAGVQPSDRRCAGQTSPQ